MNREINFDNIIDYDDTTQTGGAARKKRKAGSKKKSKAGSKAGSKTAAKTTKTATKTTSKAGSRKRTTSKKGKSRQGRAKTEAGERARKAKISKMMRNNKNALKQQGGTQIPIQTQAHPRAASRDSQTGGAKRRHSKRHSNQYGGNTGAKIARK